MMVVIGIIAILGAVIVPGFKKIYSDFKVMETFYFINTAMSAQRAFYLVRNERPIIYGVATNSLKCVEERMLPFLPQGWATNTTFSNTSSTIPSTGHSIRFYKLAPYIKPYETCSGGVFNIGHLSITIWERVDIEYAEKLSNMCKQKGYGLTKESSSSYFYSIHLPEKYNTKPISSQNNDWMTTICRWFR